MKDFFDTSHLSKNFARKTVSGGAAVGASRILSFILSMGSTAVLARLLVPEDFGLVAMVMAIIGFVEVFREMGLSMATVQRQDVTHGQISNLFWVNALFGSLVALLIVAASPLIGIFYNDTRLPAIAAVLSIQAVFSGLTVQHQALARRHMRFWLVQASGLVGNMIGIAVAVAMAVTGFDYWALVWRTVVASGATFLVLWIFVPWRPGLPQRGTGVRDMLTFGMHITASRFMRKAKSLVDKVLIGSFAGAASLGLYSKAFGLLMLPIQQINYPVSSVAFPALSRLQNDTKRFQTVYYQGIGLIVSLAMPATTFLLITADDLIPIFLGPGWDGAVILFQALAPAAFIQALDVTRAWATIPMGQSRRIMIVGMIDAILSILSFCVGIFWGALGVAVAFSISAAIKFVPLNMYALQGSPVSFSGLFANALMLPAFFCSISAFGVFLLNAVWPMDNHFISFGAQAVVFGALYTSLPLLIPGGRKLFTPLQEAVSILFGRAKYKAAL
jgi:PST family polysaccharide transporter